jgi:hypothetical protein
MIFFPSWLQHAALTTKAEEEGGYRVIFAFNIAIGGQPSAMRPLDWHTDPVSGYQFTQRVSSDNYERGLPDFSDRNSSSCDHKGPARIEL